MQQKVLDKQSIKILILYIMQNVGTPLDFLSVNEMLLQTEFVLYLDLVECFSELERDALISPLPHADGENALYTVSDRGRMVAEQLSGQLRPSILEESLRTALRYLDFKKQNIQPHCLVTQRPDGSAEFYCSLTREKDILFETRVRVDSVQRANEMEEVFRSRPETVYRGMWSLLSGNVKFLFD